MRLVPYLLYLLLIAFFRTNLIDFLSIGPIQIFLTPLIVLLVALRKDYLTALWFGFAAGLIYDAPDPSYLGVQMLILSILGLATAQARTRFNLESSKSQVLLVWGGLLVFLIPHTLIYGTSAADNFLSLFFRSTLPSSIYTAFLGWLFFMINSGRLSLQKLKTIF